MRKGKRQQRDFFKKLESGGPEDEELGAKPEPKLLVGKLKSEVRAIEVHVCYHLLFSDKIDMSKMCK